MSIVNKSLRLSIAVNLVDAKIAEVLRIEKQNTDVKIAKDLDKKFKYLICERELVYQGNEKFIDKIIKEAEEQKNDKPKFTGKGSYLF